MEAFARYNARGWGATATRGNLGRGRALPDPYGCPHDLPEHGPAVSTALLARIGEGRSPGLRELAIVAEKILREGVDASGNDQQPPNSGASNGSSGR